jgi:predicted MFS family arabinose efflux permease
MGNYRESILTCLKKVISGRALTRLLMPGMFLQTLSASILIPVLPVFAGKNLGLSHNSYGLLLMAGGAATVISLFPMGRLVNQIRPERVLSGGLLTASAAIAGLLLAGNKHNAIIWVLGLGFSYAAILPAWNTLLSRAVPRDKQATGWGVLSTVEGLGISLGPALGGALAGSFSPGAVLLAAAGLLLVMTLFYSFLPVRNFL